MTTKEQAWADFKRDSGIESKLEEFRRQDTGTTVGRELDDSRRNPEYRKRLEKRRLAMAKLRKKRGYN